MFEEYVQPIVDFVRLHQVWAAPVVFALCFVESLAFVSLIVPAWGALVVIGTMIQAGGLNFWPIWIAGSIGAALGDWLSYWIGRKLEHTVQHIWPLSRHPDLIPKGEAFIKKWGALGIFIGRFSAPCGLRCRWWRASSKCRSGDFRSRTSPPHSFGPRCCS